MTSCDATGRAIAKELVAVVREMDIKLEVMGMVGCGYPQRGDTGVGAGAGGCGQEHQLIVRLI